MHQMSFYRATPDLRLHRRRLLQTGLAAACASVLPACADMAGTQPLHQMPASARLRLFACSNYLVRPERIDIGIERLRNAGFTLDNTEALYRRYQRFAGTDAQRTADLQDVATGRVPVPKMLLGTRGGYGAIRLLPAIDWASLGSRMREAGTLLVGYSDICAIQLALLAQGNMGSFAGPMFYSEFGNPDPSLFTLQQFVDTVTSNTRRVQVPTPISQHVDVSGIVWGGNLSVLASLAGSPWMPDIADGILFLEDVGEQPYRLERMLQTLYLSGVFKRQRAIVLGTFRMSTVRDLYDDSYDFDSVVATLRRLTGLPVVTEFPFGHIRDKVTVPLGFPARLRADSNGYSLAFSGYPTLNPSGLRLHTLTEAMAGEPASTSVPAGDRAPDD